MKKLMLFLIALGAICTAQAQDFAQIAKQQIENHVKLPCEIAMAAPHLIDSLQLDRVTMQLLIKPNGKVKQSQISFPKPTITPILLLLVEASKKVRIDKELIAAPMIILVDFRLKLENTHSSPNYGPRHTYSASNSMSDFNQLYPSSLPVGANLSKYALRHSRSTYTRIYHNNQSAGRKNAPTTYSLDAQNFGKGLPRYIVSLAE